MDACLCAIIFIYLGSKALWILWLKQALLKYAISDSVQDLDTHSCTRGQNITLVTVSRNAAVGGALNWPSNTKQPFPAASQLLLTLPLYTKFALCTFYYLPLYISTTKRSLSLEPYPILRFHR